MKQVIINIVLFIGLYATASAQIIKDDFATRVVRQGEQTIVQIKYNESKKQIAKSTTSQIFFGGIQLPVSISSSHIDDIRIGTAMEGIYYMDKFPIDATTSNYVLNIIPNALTELSNKLLSGEWIDAFIIESAEISATVAVLSTLDDSQQIVPYIGFVSKEGIHEFVVKIKQENGLPIEQEKVIISPNPATDNIVVDASRYFNALAKSTNYTIELLDAMGKRLQNISTKQSKQSVDISTLHKGMYNVRILYNGEIIAQKRISKV